MFVDIEKDSNAWGLAANLINLTVASGQNDIHYAPRLWSQICVTCRSWWFPDSVALSCYTGARCFRPLRQNLCVLSLYSNPDLDNQIFDCLLASMAAVHFEEVRTSFLFVGNLNGHHQECLGSTTTNLHHWLCNCLWLRSVGCRLNPCTWWSTWPTNSYWYTKTLEPKL